ncbi:MAG: beta-galactosidase [Lachnospiraceae bacterium]|nr:beta-galactosidase [Lachnospiraceae bacterium]
MIREITKADLGWLDDPSVFGVNRVPAHSDHTFWADEEEAYTFRDKSLFESSLVGDWNFIYSVNASERPADFYSWDYTDRAVLDKFDTIEVPGHIEIAGYDKFHYINTCYPWEGHIFRRPLDRDGNAVLTGSFAKADYNPVGSYVKVFDIPEKMNGTDFRIRFEGVEQAYYVWLNGTFIGYSEDSFTPHEFLVTDVIKEKGNVLAVEVHKRSTAAFLEDQDFFRFFGIFRPVKLIATPKVHVEDLDIRTVLNEDNASGSISVRLKLKGFKEAGRISMSVTGPGEKTVLEASSLIGDLKTEDSGEGEFTYITLPEHKLDEVRPWSFIPEPKGMPPLYYIRISVFDKEDKCVELVPYAVGFRRIEIKDNVVYLNGKRLRICGVNRHEWDPERGRAIGFMDMAKDMDLIRKNNINAVRTCHYPDRIEWYGYCDLYGIYMMAETNMETHGSWMKFGAIDPSWNVPGNSQVWQEAVLDRAKSNYEWFKNHTSIIFWSLGNESFAGEAIVEMNRFFKSKNDGRLVHYEGVSMNREGYEDRISDVESRMYAKPHEIEEYLDNDPKKPFILCEYMHCMGNSLGGFNSYMKLFDKYESFVGGFIWDFKDQAIYVTDEITGKRVLRYGGDFDDRPADNEFSQNGIVFADRTEKPGIQEVRYYYGKYNS